MEDFLKSIFSNDIISTLFSLSLTILVGLFIGSIKIFKINIGITGVLFAGLGLSYLGVSFNEVFINFIRDFGLVLFVYAVGIQVGNGFFSAFKKNGLVFNLAALFIIIGNIIMVLFIKKILRFDGLTSIGIYCGSVTNTPALAASQEIVSTISVASLNIISAAYALTYPGAIVSLVLTMIILKNIFRKEYEEEITKISEQKEATKIINVSARIENKNLDNIMLKDIPAIDELKIVITRIKKADGIYVAQPETKLNIGDIVLCVGEEKNIDEFVKIIGSMVDFDFKKQSEKIINTRAIVTNKNLVGKKISETKIPSYRVVITRVSRSDVEFIVSNDYEIQLGDNLVIVGEEENVLKVIKFIGNSPKDLNHPNLIPIFIGIILGIILGILPLYLPFISKPLKLGLAGGTLIAAIILSNTGNIGKISWYIPPAANLMLREIGIVMFLAAVGLKSGASFFKMFSTYNGLIIIISGFFVSITPITIAGYILKKYYKLHYLTICGLLSGAMTDPPALAYANSIADSNLQSIAYSTVYPFTMFMRIVSAQILVFILYG